MDDVISSPPSPTVKKRALPVDESPVKKPLNLRGTQFAMSTPPDTDQSSIASASNLIRCDRAASTTSASSEVSSVNFAVQPADESRTATEPDGDAGTNWSAMVSGEPPKKRRKLTAAEKEEQQRLKEAKEREKAELKLRREEDRRAKEVHKFEEKAKRDEDKRMKDEDKRRKAEERDAKKREKEVEEEKKLQERQKKARSQMKLGEFFQKSRTPTKQNGDCLIVARDSSELTRRRSLSLEIYDKIAEEVNGAISTVAASPIAKADPPIAVIPLFASISDYQKIFLPFQPQSHTTWARRAQANVPLERIEASQAQFDREIRDQSLRGNHGLSTVDTYGSLVNNFRDVAGQSRGFELPSARHLIERMQGSSAHPVDLTGNEPEPRSLQILQLMTRRHIYFHEDVRPAYCGTYTKIRPRNSMMTLGRSPFRKQRPDTDYDYDSEAEWMEEEEGEDISDNEDDEPESLGDENEMKEFLDDEDDKLVGKRRMIIGDLQAISSGICWQDDAGKLITKDTTHGLVNEVDGLGMTMLLPDVQLTTIDPFSTSYWQTDAPAKDEQSTASVECMALPVGCMAPPARPPLQQLPNGSCNLPIFGAAQVDKGPTPSVPAEQRTAGRKPAPKTMTDEELASLRVAVVGSPLGKADLCKQLKARFPKLANGLIKTTVGSHFAQVGNTKAEKKWVYVGNV